MFFFDPTYEKEEPLHLRVVMNRNEVTATVALLYDREKDRLEEYGTESNNWRECLSLQKKNIYETHPNR